MGNMHLLATLTAPVYDAWKAAFNAHAEDRGMAAPKKIPAPALSPGPGRSIRATSEVPGQARDAM